MTALAAVVVFTACDGNPFIDPVPAPPAPAPPTGPTTVGGVDLPDGSGGTAAPTAGSPITRYESGGSAEDVTYDAATDTITIDNLPFDGIGLHERDGVLPNLIVAADGFMVYENNNPTERRAYKTIYKSSTSGETSFAITRTGDYLGFGFGGFVYARNGAVVLPVSGQATFTGEYAGIRVFEGVGGLEYTTADVFIEVDFEDFDATDAVEGALTNRTYYDQSGAPLGNLPTLVLGTGSISAAGEIGGTAVSSVLDGGGNSVPFEAGEYYAVLSGDPANEMVGVIVITGDDPNDVLDGGPNTIVQETGGFIVTSP